MAKLNVKLDVPDELVPKILGGSVDLMGLAKNSANKQVVKHIPVAKVSKDNSLRNGALIGVGTFVAIGVTALVTTLVVKHNDKVKTEKTIQELISKHYNDTISTYLINAQKGQITKVNIEELFNYFDSMAKDIDLKNIEIELSNEDIKVLGKLIFTFTMKLCKANKKSAPQLEYQSKKEMNAQENLVFIRDCLYTQNEIAAMA